MEWGTWQIWGKLVGDYVKIWQHVIPSEDAGDVFLSVWMLGPLMPSPKHPEPKMTDRPPTSPGWRKLGTCAVEETGWIKAAIAASADVSGWAHKGLTIEHHQTKHTLGLLWPFIPFKDSLISTVNLYHRRMSMWNAARSCLSKRRASSMQESHSPKVMSFVQRR